ncbi:MAG: IS66 family transposase [Bdellovibrionales bacterium]|jgi:transposase
MMTERERQILENEKDPRVLRALINDLVQHNQKLKSRIDQIERENAEKDQAAFNLEERVKLMRRQVFGKSSEKRVEASDRPRDKSQEAALVFSQAAFPAFETRSEQQKGKAKGGDLEEVVIDHHPTEKDLVSEGESRDVDAASASQWEDTGLYDESIKITIVERRYVKEIHRRHKYRLKEKFNPNPEKEVIITANGPAELLKGMNYSIDFVAAVIADKYISHMPLERQTREMESLGLRGMKNSTLSRMAALGAAALEPMQKAILRQDLLTSDLGLHLDETPWKIQCKQEKDGFMWVISNRYGSYYFFKPTRSGQVLREKLNGYAGPVLTDGFCGYNVVAELGIKQGYCWAHARREFIPLESHDPTVKPILDLIDELFAIEREAKTLNDVGSLRLAKSKPVVEKIKTLLLEEHPRSRPGSQKRKAIEYVTKRWDGLTLFLTETKLPLSNNEAERTIRHAVVGRKNYYGSGNHVGAETAATLFTVIESCKKNDIDPRTFLIMSLHRAARGEPLETPLAYARRIRSNQPA